MIKYAYIFLSMFLTISFTIDATEPLKLQYPINTPAYQTTKFRITESYTNKNSEENNIYEYEGKLEALLSIDLINDPAWLTFYLKEYENNNMFVKESTEAIRNDLVGGQFLIENKDGQIFFNGIYFQPFKFDVTLHNTDLNDLFLSVTDPIFFLKENDLTIGKTDTFFIVHYMNIMTYDYKVKEIDDEWIYIDIKTDFEDNGIYFGMIIQAKLNRKNTLVHEMTIDFHSLIQRNSFELETIGTYDIVSKPVE